MTSTVESSGVFCVFICGWRVTRVFMSLLSSAVLIKRPYLVGAVRLAALFSRSHNARRRMKSCRVHSSFILHSSSKNIRVLRKTEISVFGDLVVNERREPDRELAKGK